jgi:hypothetical protein
MSSVSLQDSQLQFYDAIEDFTSDSDSDSGSDQESDGETAENNRAKKSAIVPGNYELFINITFRTMSPKNNLILTSI